MRTGNVCVALALMSAAACGGSGGSTTPTQQPIGNTTPPAGGVSVTNSGYSPSAKTVAAGAAVQWAWNTCTGDPYSGQTCASHSVTFDDGVTSPTQDQGTFSRAFSVTGSYPYHCAVHGAAMSGSVTVQ
jgi:plastocyanin